MVQRRITAATVVWAAGVSTALMGVAGFVGDRARTVHQWPRTRSAFGKVRGAGGGRRASRWSACALRGGFAFHYVNPASRKTAGGKLQATCDVAASAVDGLTDEPGRATVLSEGTAVYDAPPVLPNSVLLNDTIGPGAVDPNMVGDILQAAGDATALSLHGESPSPYDTSSSSTDSPQRDLEEGKGKGKVTTGWRELVYFTLPLLAIWLSNPIMSLVDTAVVGARSSVQLAALGPATALCDNFAYILTFLASVTTSLVGAARGAGQDEVADRATSTGIAVASVIGVAVTAMLLAFGRSFLMLFLGGNASAVKNVLPHSLGYVRIRALAFAPVTLTMVLQGYCLARKDTQTPLKVVAFQAIVNLVVDIFLVFGCGMGITGAALATALAQTAGAALIVQKVLPKLRCRRSLPTKRELGEFLGLGVPTSLGLVGQVATCAFLTVAASSCHTVALAAHQVMYGIFLLFCPIGEAVSQTVQAYLPELMVRKPPPKPRTARRRKSLKNGRNTAAPARLGRPGGSEPEGLPPPAWEGSAHLTEPRLAGADDHLPLSPHTNAWEVYPPASYSAPTPAGRKKRRGAASRLLKKLPRMSAKVSQNNSNEVSKPKSKEAAAPSMTFSEPAVAMFRLILRIAGSLGVACAGLAACLAWGLPFAFTPDRAVWAAMRSVAPLVGLTLAVHALCMAMQGAMMAARDGVAMAVAYGVASLIFCAKFVSMRGSPGLSLVSVWKVFVIYQMVRTVLLSAAAMSGHRSTLLAGLLGRKLPNLSGAPAEPAPASHPTEAAMAAPTAPHPSWHGSTPQVEETDDLLHVHRHGHGRLDGGWEATTESQYASPSSPPTPSYELGEAVGSGSLGLGPSPVPGARGQLVYDPAQEEEEEQEAVMAAPALAAEPMMAVEAESAAAAVSDMEGMVLAVTEVNANAVVAPLDLAAATAAAAMAGSDPPSLSASSEEAEAMFREHGMLVSGGAVNPADSTGGDGAVVVSAPPHMEYQEAGSPPGSLDGGSPEDVHAFLYGVHTSAGVAAAAENQS